MIESSNLEKLSTNQILCKIGDFIEEVGWTQGKLQDENTGAVCLLGAINSVLGGSAKVVPDHIAIRFDVVGEIRERIRNKGQLTNDSLVDWNDVSGRTQEQVVAILKEDC